MAGRVKKTHKTKKPTRKSSRRAEAKATTRQARPASADAKAVQRALSQMEKAYQALAAKGSAVLALADQLQQAAVQKYVDGLVKALESEKFLRDILALRDAFNAVPKGQLPPDVEILRLLPDAFLAWLKDRFAIAPHLVVNQEIEIPASKLAGYDVANDVSQISPNDLVKIKVICPGWKCNGKPIAPAQVKLVVQEAV